MAVKDRDPKEETVELDPVLLWRFEELHRAGFSVIVSWGLAENPNVDIHRAAALLAEGCKPELAVQILA